MVMKGRKSKSKRVTLKQKHKIIRNLKVHHKKKAKEAKKQIVTSKHKSDKYEKDPVIPNDRPLKEQELKALEVRRVRAIADIEQNKERAQKRKLGLLEDDGIGNLSRDEPKEFGKSRDNSGRAFYKELVKVIEESDVILEVLDARDPLGTRCVDMEKMVMKSGPEKHIVLLLNKIDLVPREVVEKWLKYLREELPAVAFKCSTQEQRSNYGWKPAPKFAKTNTLLQTSDCLGAETLIKLLKNYSRSHEIKKSITVGVIGLPNVGKSSLINSLRRSHVVNVGSTPGLTRSMQQVQLDKNVKLLDCPGVVMLKSGENDARITLRNCKRIEKLDDPIGPVKEILNLCPKETLAPLYKLQSFDLVDDFLQKVANVRGKLKKGGLLDVEAAARIVLHDWNEGKIPYYTMPPSRNQGENLEATIVSELGKEFHVEEVYKGESSFIGSLKSVEDFHNVEVPSRQPLDFDEKMLEDEVQPDVLIESNKQPEEMSDDRNVDHHMEDHGKEGDRSNAKSTKRKQNEKLYTAEGILNPRLRKAEKKKRKKALRSSSGDDVMDADYDFKVNFTNRGINMDVGDDDDDDKDGVDHQNNCEEAMTVV